MTLQRQLLSWIKPEIKHIFFLSNWTQNHDYLIKILYTEVVIKLNSSLEQK